MRDKDRGDEVQNERRDMAVIFTARPSSFSLQRHMQDDIKEKKKTKSKKKSFRKWNSICPD